MPVMDGRGGCTEVRWALQNVAESPGCVQSVTLPAWASQQPIAGQLIICTSATR